MGTLTTEFFVTGGTLRRDAECYVVRQADRELLAGLRQGKFCYVLTSRQMGKSSLMVRIAAQLREEGCGVVILDLTAIGQNLSAEQWYRGLLGQMGYQLELEDELIEFWRGNKELGAMQRWMRAIREVVLPCYPGPVVIFIDEIDAVLSLPFSTDKFFAAIREFYNRRTEDEELGRLTFCLLGVATPSDLIRDTRTTPFNIGQRIELHDFTEAEAVSLAQGLRHEEKTSVALLKRIHYWAGGHPYLTQRLCQAIADFNPQSAIGNQKGPQSVDRLCEELFFSPRAQERDDNLLFVRERMLHSEVELPSLLQMYKQVWRGRHLRDDEADPVMSVLRLSGIVRVESGRFRERNRIYARVFDREWIKTNMPDAEMQRQRTAFRRGLLRATAVAAVILAVMTTLVWFAIQQRNRAIEQGLINRRSLYAAHMNLAQQGWDTKNIEGMRELVESYLPQPGQEELRGFEWYYLWRLCHSFQTLRHGDSVTSLAFSPDSKMLATGSWNYTVRLWDVNTRQELSRFEGLENKAQVMAFYRVQAVAFSPDGKTLAIAGDDNTVRLRESASGKELLTLAGHLGNVTSVAFSPDGRVLASGSADSTVRLWERSTGRELLTLKGHKGRVFSVAFSPDGKLLASGTDEDVAASDHTVKLWDVTTGRELITFTGRKCAIRSIAFSPDGKLLASTTVDNIVILCDVLTGKVVKTFKGHTNLVSAVAFSPDGKRLASGSYDRTIKLWDVVGGQELVTLKGHSSNVNDLAFSPDGKTLASGSGDGIVALWEVTTIWEQSTLEGHRADISSVAFSPDGKTLASSSHDNTAKLWDVISGRPLAAFTGHTGWVRCLKFSPDGKTLATSSHDGTVRLWDLTSGREQTIFKGPGKLSSVAFSPDGNILAAGSDDGPVKLWDVASRQELATLIGHSDLVRCMVFSFDGKALATASYDGTVRLWDVASRQALFTFMGHAGPVFSVAFSPDGKWLASGSNDRTVKLLESATGALLNTLKGRSDGILSVAFSPDGKRLATASSDNTMKLWDTGHWQELSTFKGHSAAVASVAFSPDGQTLATGSDDWTVRLWRAASEKEVLIQNR